MAISLKDFFFVGCSTVQIHTRKSVVCRGRPRFDESCAVIAINDMQARKYMSGGHKDIEI